MRKWLYYLWWKTKAIRRLIELTNCKPYHAIQFVKETTKAVDPYIWVPANPEKFIETQQNEFAKWVEQNEKRSKKSNLGKK